ncbi:hypothetical protein J2Z69_000112 [Paenibacillus shirakamiensis]|uniref:Uncharacterized protein n=1 Tax=Paenibacillus shirakamiensis TaxID=1265935 RepID=A0ABS4JBL4_9BACL|nr:hypothetical protein [Paenibacillus shirakamiensis]MBP1999093.1 hypothetical protein [Paenibacillus shirakamiensis]
MKKINCTLMIITLLSVSLIGCGNSSPRVSQEQSSTQTQLPEKTAENQKKVTVSPTMKNNDNEYERLNYFMPSNKAEITSSKNQITWKKDNISLIARTSSTTINSIQVTNSKAHYDIHIPKDIQVNHAKLTSIALSPSGRFLAINIFVANVGNQLIVVNLENGTSTIMNKLTQVTYETIHAYNWAPLGNKLAFSYGDTSSSTIAIYDFKHQEVKTLPHNSNLINTLYIMWNTEGTHVDFISEAPSDKFKLYRYAAGANTLKEISAIALDELPKYSKYAPQPLNL